jgi:two-component system heavy metal sensor histidine kinase CusS
LFLARSENTRASLNLQELSLNRELALIAEFYSAAADQAQVALHLEAEAVTLLADRSLLQRAVSNLISNAIEHTAPGGEIRINASGGDAAVVIDVADNGAGMSAEVRQHALDRFYRGGSARSGTGLGLGLAITKAVMDLHAGAVELTSEPGAGTRARLIFPRHVTPTRLVSENYRAEIVPQ